MKKLTYLVHLFLLTLCISIGTPVLAQNDRDEDVRNERNDDRDRRDADDRNDRDNLRDEDDNEAREDDDDSDYGWIGLLGLAGLAGLLRRPEKRVVHGDTLHRTTDTGRTNLGRDTDINRNV